jgi:hypothetical protein
MTAKPHRQPEQGQALVEFALTIPILLMMIFGVIDIARTVFALSQVIDASRQAVRYGIVTGLVAGHPQYLDCAGIRATAASVPGFVDLRDVTVDIFYEDAQNQFLADCTDGLTVWDVGNGDVLAVHVQGSLRPLTPVFLIFTDTFTFDYTSRRTIVTEGSALVTGDEWPTPPEAAGHFSATVNCAQATNNVSFSWDPTEVPTRIEIRDSYSSEIVAVPSPENAFCTSCATINRDGGSGMYYMVMYTGEEPNLIAGPSSSDTSVNCPELGSISGMVFADADNDGRKGHSETGITSVTVALVGAGADNVFATADDLTFPSVSTDAGCSPSRPWPPVCTAWTCRKPARRFPGRR